ncbi:MAG: hypothetical protein WD766_01610 [Gemmatimonadota bacterium]
MNHDVRGEGVADPVLAAAMAELRKDVPKDVDWDGLRRSVSEQAELILARRRVRIWNIVPRPLVPIAVAASIAFALWAGPSLFTQLTSGTGPTEVAVEIDEEQILLDALGADLTEQEFRLLVTGRADPDALLAFAIGDR